MRENPTAARDGRGAARRAARDHPSWRQAEADRLGARPVQERRVLVAVQMPDMRRRANRLWLIEDRPLCRHCCEGIGIVHRSKWGFGRHERLRARDQKLDELIAKLDATTGRCASIRRPNIGAAERGSSAIAAGLPRACDAR